MKVEFPYIEKHDVYLWGNGNILKRYWNQLPKELKIKGIVDSDASKCGLSEYTRDGTYLQCILPNEMDLQTPVIVCVENPRTIKSITEMLDSNEKKWCHIYDVVDYNLLTHIHEAEDDVTQESTEIVKFIDTVVPIASCNLQCEYCYLGQKNVILDHYPELLHSAKYIRHALAKKRLGGVAFINLCGVGETLLCKELIEIVDELIKEGHYVQIVTNTTISKKIDDFIDSNIDFSHLFFKCSLHFSQLKEKNLLHVFAENVKKIESRGGSYTIEIVPTDNLVPFIPEIQSYCEKNFGALPHVTITRDESFSDYHLWTEYSLDEYKNIWGIFDSPMFNFKYNEYILSRKQSDRYRNCKAGLWACELNLATGELQKCVNNPRLCNIYENIDAPIIFEEVGNNCCMPYCFNCHAYLTLGLIPEINAPSYCEMRDRVTADGKHWITEKIRNVFNQKLYINNKWK